MHLNVCCYCIFTWQLRVFFNNQKMVKVIDKRFFLDIEVHYHSVQYMKNQKYDLSEGVGH